MKKANLTVRITVEVPDDTKVEALHLAMLYEDFKIGGEKGVKVVAFETENVEELTAAAGDYCPKCGDFMVLHKVGAMKTVLCQGCGYSPDWGDDE